MGKSVDRKIDMAKFKLYLFVVLAVLLLLCLFHMPYGYYMFVRFITMALGIYFASTEFKDERVLLGIIWIAIAILFQPFFKIALGRTLWNIVDMIVAGVAMCCFYITVKHNREEKQ
jgi:apolipoprotein N-acyltransferase